MLVMTADLFTTFDEADHTNPYELARRWADHGVTSLDPAAEQISELATMAALSGRLQRWLPAQIHRALLKGATLDGVVAATGRSRREVNDLWREWVDGQLHLRAEVLDLRDITAEVAMVDAVFAEQM